MKRTACIIVEHINGVISDCSFELASLAHTSPFREKYAWIALMAGHEIEKSAESFAKKSGVDVIALCSHTLVHYSAEGCTHAFAHAIKELSPALVCASHSPIGCDFAPALAVACSMHFASGVQNIAIADDALIMARERMNGKIREEIRSTEPTVCTVMPGAYTAVQDNMTHGKAIIRHIHLGDVKSSAGEIITAQREGAELTEAEVIVAAGRGVGTPEHMKLIQRFASLFPRSAVGGSRAACDMGLVDYGFQIGSTGRSVSPRLYIACGISGSAQHIAGMKNSRIIIAINRDETAPIFQVADVGIVDTIERFVPEFIEFYKKL